MNEEKRDFQEKKTVCIPKQGNEVDNRAKPFPPKLTWWQKWIVIPSTWVLLLIASLYLLDQLCFRKIFVPSLCCTYIALGIVLIILVFDRWIHWELTVHKARLEDISEVQASFVEAETVQTISSGKMSGPEYFKQKKSNLLKEVDRLKDIGNYGWTEYQVLSLNQMLVEFLEEGELIARARSSLADLEDYAVDSAYRYDQKQYEKWKDSIDKAMNKINEAETDNEKRDKAIETLRAELQTLLDHIASYSANWSKGSAILNEIRICGVLGMPLLLIMGLLPNIHPSIIGSSDGILTFLNWGLLGMVGAITAVLLSLRKSDYVEVGNTEGRKELWRAIPGVGLGLIAGTIAYWMIAGGLFESGSIVPKLENDSLRDIGLSTLWAVASGFYFEKVFDRMLSSTIGGDL